VTERPLLEVQGLEKFYVGSQGRVRVLRGVSFQVSEGSFYTLLGPSGCGKTTTLRCVAGLEKPDGGRIAVAGVSMAGEGRFVPPYQRDIGMVFQSYAIWPHMTVFDNTAFPLRVGKRKTPKAEIKRLVEEALGTVALEGLEGRMATQLSGGQQQRLALARALVRRPKLLLLDEPLSNLDAKLRERMRTEVRSLQRRLGVTALYVTHDQAEALSMSNRIAVMDGGEIVQEGAPRAIYQQPLTSFVANFVGATNFVEAEVVTAGEGGTLRTPLGSAPVLASCPVDVPVGEKVTLAVRPENIEVHAAAERPAEGTANAFTGTVEQAMFLGDTLDLQVRVGAASLSTRAHPTVRLRPGDEITVLLRKELCAVLTDRHGVAAGAY
jgi:iron(III) transport system ATP-binding protein